MKRELALAILVASIGNLTASEAYLEHPTFFIERSKNKNEVHYKVRTDSNCKFLKSDPIVGYWKELEAGPNVTSELSSFDKIAYGISETSHVSENDLRFSLSAIPTKVYEVISKKSEKGCVVKTYTLFNEKRGILHKVHVLSRERLIMPKVIEITFYGTSDDGIKLIEKINPE